jgi:Na+-translocating ferredoxin:NAD+ oxidoreductase subunit B
MTSDPLAARIDALLPQTQCTRCGYPACRPYAEAIATGEADINRCPPGGATGIAALAQLLDRAVLPLDPDCGEEAPMRLARIREDDCIGCMKCVLACPVDAIVGTSKRMHAVIAARCTGCELCLPPCPVDCIDLVAAPPGRDAVREADASRTRYEARRERLVRDEAERDARLRAKRDGLA